MHRVSETLWYVTKFLKVRNAANMSLSGYDDYQIYLLLGCAPVQGHVAGIVDVSPRVNRTPRALD